MIDAVAPAIARPLSEAPVRRRVLCALGAHVRWRECRGRADAGGAVRGWCLANGLGRPLACGVVESFMLPS